MKKIYRLKKSSEFKETMNYNLKARTPQYLVFVKPNKMGYMRIGISVSKKVGNAVIRVKVRRQIRAFFSIYNKYEKSYDIVIITKPKFLELSSLENKESLLSSISSLIAKGENTSE
jgi:ribonuclease P protein component